MFLKKAMVVSEMMGDRNQWVVIKGRMNLQYGNKYDEMVEKDGDRRKIPEMNGER